MLFRRHMALFVILRPFTPGAPTPVLFPLMFPRLPSDSAFLASDAFVRWAFQITDLARLFAGVYLFIALFRSLLSLYLLRGRADRRLSSVRSISSRDCQIPLATSRQSARSAILTMLGETFPKLYDRVSGSPSLFSRILRRVKLTLAKKLPVLPGWYRLRYYPLTPRSGLAPLHQSTRLYRFTQARSFVR